MAEVCLKHKRSSLLGLDKIEVFNSSQVKTQNASKNNLVTEAKTQESKTEPGKIFVYYETCITYNNEI